MFSTETVLYEGTNRGGYAIQLVADVKTNGRNTCYFIRIGEVNQPEQYWSRYDPLTQDFAELGKILLGLSVLSKLNILPIKETVEQLKTILRALPNYWPPKQKT